MDTITNTIKLAFLAVLMCVCCSSCFKKTYSGLANEIMNEQFEEGPRKGVYALIIGGTRSDIVFDMGYSSYMELDVQTARPLIIELTEELLKKINQDLEIRPFLGNDFPFPQNKTIICVIFFNPKTEFIWEEGQLTAVDTRDGYISYWAYDPKECEVLLCRETYEEALKIEEARVQQTVQP